MSGSAKDRPGDLGQVNVNSLSFPICKMGLNCLPQRVAATTTEASALGKTWQQEDLSKCQLLIRHHLIISN